MKPEQLCSIVFNYKRELAQWRKVRAILPMGTYKTGWWFGTWLLFSHILGIIIPFDFHIFQRGRYTTNQQFFDVLPVEIPQFTDICCKKTRIEVPKSCNLSCKIKMHGSECVGLAGEGPGAGELPNPRATCWTICMPWLMVFSGDEWWWSPPGISSMAGKSSMARPWPPGFPGGPGGQWFLFFSVRRH